MLCRTSLARSWGGRSQACFVAPLWHGPKFRKEEQGESNLRGWGQIKIESEKERKHPCSATSSTKRALKKGGGGSSDAAFVGGGAGRNDGAEPSRWRYSSRPDLTEEGLIRKALGNEITT